MLKLVLAVMPYISSAAARDAENSQRHANNTQERVRKRVEREATDTPDIFQHIIANGGLTEDEMVSKSMILITAGAETTATMLTASSMFKSRSSPPSECYQDRAA